MSVPAFPVLEGLLRFASAGEADKIERSLQLLSPLLAEHERLLDPPGSGAAVAALRSGESARLEAAARSLIAHDVIALLRRLDPATPDRSRTWARTAVLEWRLIEGAAIGRDLRGAQAVAAAFRDLVDALEAGDLDEARAAVLPVEKALKAFIEIR